MGVPKRKPSTSRQRMRRAYNSVLTVPKVQACPNCSEATRPHRVCPSCGFYNGRQIITVKAAA
jgi:large subunit ribosomal protein L32